MNIKTVYKAMMKSAAESNYGYTDPDKRVSIPDLSGLKPAIPLIAGPAATLGGAVTGAGLLGASTVGGAPAATAISPVTAIPAAGVAIGGGIYTARANRNFSRLHEAIKNSVAKQKDTLNYYDNVYKPWQNKHYADLIDKLKLKAGPTYKDLVNFKFWK